MKTNKNSILRYMFLQDTTLRFEYNYFTLYHCKHKDHWKSHIADNLHKFCNWLFRLEEDIVVGYVSIDELETVYPTLSVSARHVPNNIRLDKKFVLYKFL